MSDHNTPTTLLPFTRTSVMGQINYPTHDYVPGKPPEPWLSISGDWLREAGFKGGQKLKIQYGWRQLLITPVDEPS